MAELIDLAVTAAGNTARFPENMQFRAVNDAARELEAMIARELRDRNMSIAASGSSNAFAITTSQTITSYTDNLLVGFTANHTITGAATLAVNGMPAKAITAQDGSALGRNDIVSGQKVLVVYKTSSGAFQIVGGRVAGSSADILARIVKAGMVMAWPIGTAPTGWLECNGAAISRTTYAELFAAIGTTYGAGDGSTTFNLPDYRGEFLRGFANGSSNDPNRTTRTNRGDGTTGDAVGTKQADATEAHTHSASLSTSVTGTTSTVGDHSHTYNVPTSSVLYGAGGSGTVWLASTSSALTGAAGSHSHTVSATGTATGTTGSTSGDETRPRNVSVMWIILANPAAASAATLGVSGFSYTFDTGTTDADPGSGKLRYNDATVASVTGIYVSETDGYGANIAAAILALPVNSNLYIYKIGSPATFAYFTMGATGTDGGTYDKLLSLTHVASNGTFSNGDSLALVPFRAGATGATGATGAAGSDGGIRWTFDSSTTMADPGTGDLRLNNAALGSVTEIAISALNAETGNPDLSGWVSTWDDSTTTAHRGQILLRKASAPENFALLDLTSDVTDNTTWLTMTVAVIDSAGSFSAADTLFVSFYRTGDKGLDGAGSGTLTGVTAGGGLSTSGVGSAGGTITVSGTMTAVKPINAQTGTTYTFVTGDNAKLVTFSNASAVAVTLPQATSTFGAGWYVNVVNKGAGTVTITPTTSTINGASSLALATNQGCLIVSDGTNYQIERGHLPASGVTPGSYTGANITVDARGIVTAAATGSSSIPTPPQGRLALSTATPVMTSTVSGATTIYYTPYSGRAVPLWNGSTFTMTDTGGELSQATTDSTKSPAAVANNSNYDLFVWSDGGTMRCTRGPAWASDTARHSGSASELELLQGFYVNKYAITNGPAAQRGTYVGTIRTNGSAAVDWLLNTSGAGGSESKLHVWNAYNRVAVATTVNDTTDSWTSTTNAYEALNAGVGSGAGNRISVVRGIDEDEVMVDLRMPAAHSAGANGGVGIGLNSSSANAAQSVCSVTLSSSFIIPPSAVYAANPGIGYHYFQALQRPAASGTTTFYGDGGLTFFKSGIYARIRA